MDITCAGLLPVLPDREGAVAVFDSTGEPLWSRAAFREQIGAWAGRLTAGDRALVFLLCRNDPASLTALYGALAAGHAVALIDQDASDATIGRLLETFRPDFVIGQARNSTPPASDSAIWAEAEFRGLSLREAPSVPDSPLGEDLAVLLSTSGTTGSLKFVRLAGRNLTANADQIALALGMTEHDVGIAHLPLHYSYGLSVVTSHLRVGAAVHLWQDSVTIPEFWQSVRRSEATQFPGVPYHYNFLVRGNLAKMLPPSLKTFTQAGGALAPRLQTRMHQMLGEIGGQFFVMYGQTEAAPRMTTLPSERLPEKLGSVGKALSGGRMTILDDLGDPAPPGQVGRVFYEGPNVMLGYAENRADLTLGDVMRGRLETGDLGVMDDEGYLVLTGRTKRFAKLHGLRISLDEVESRFNSVAEVAAVEGTDKILLFTSGAEAVTGLVATVAAEYKVQASNFSVRPVTELPYKSSGKIDYRALESLK